MNKNVLIIGAVLVVIVLVAFSGRFGGSKINNPQIKDDSDVEISEESKTSDEEIKEEANKEEEEESMAKNQVTIEYDEDGFEPKSVTVKSGTSVIWKNDADNSVWVASAPHPAHTDYPGFDQLKGVGKGESYTFTFTKVGKWNYHNHLKPGDWGTVVVE